MTKIPEEELVFHWGLRRSSGTQLPADAVARQVVIKGAEIKMTHVNLLVADLAQSRGRCEVNRNGQFYTSPYFRLDFLPRRFQNEVEGETA